MPPFIYPLTLRVDVVLRGTGLSGAELSDYLRWQREVRATAILHGTLLLLPELLLLLLKLRHHRVGPLLLAGTGEGQVVGEAGEYFISSSFVSCCDALRLIPRISCPPPPPPLLETW